MELQQRMIRMNTRTHTATRAQNKTVALAQQVMQREHGEIVAQNVDVAHSAADRHLEAQLSRFTGYHREESTGFSCCGRGRVTC